MEQGEKAFKGFGPVSRESFSLFIYLFIYLFIQPNNPVQKLAE